MDDTDGLDPEGEFDAWRARELARLLRDKAKQAEADAERAEIERRRAMPEDIRMAEDMEYAEATRSKEKAQMGFLQKYYHKGAFHQDDDSELFTRDYTAATESQVDMASLPKVLQVRDYGKASRSKYTHLTDQDTSSGGWGTAHQAFGRPSDTQNQGQTGCWNCGGDHMRADCPVAEDMGNPNDASLGLIDGIRIPGLAERQAAERGGFGGRGRGGRGGFGGGRGGAMRTSANTAPLGSGSRAWGAGGGGERKRPRDDDGGESGRDRPRYSDRGEDRRADDERRRDRGDDKRRDGDRDRGGDRGDRDRGDRDRDRDRGDRGERRRSRSPRRHDDRDRDRERRRDRDRDRERERERR